MISPTYKPRHGTKLERIKYHLIWTRRVDPTDICAYLDGSSKRNGRSAEGSVLQRGDQTFEKGRGIIRADEVFDAAIYGATSVLHATLTRRQRGQKIYVLLENQAAVNALKTGKSSSLLRTIRTFHDIARKANIEVRWVIGHSKIKGNAGADAEARTQLHMLPAFEESPGCTTLGYNRRLMHERQQILLNDWRSEVCHARDRDLDL